MKSKFSFTAITTPYIVDTKKPLHQPKADPSGS